MPKGYAKAYISHPLAFDDVEPMVQAAPFVVYSSFRTKNEGIEHYSSKVTSEPFSPSGAPALGPREAKRGSSPRIMHSSLRLPARTMHALLGHAGA